MKSIKRVIIAHNPVTEADDPSTADVLAQVELVEDALTRLDIGFSRVAVHSGRAWNYLCSSPGTVILNLVEAPPGRPEVHYGNVAVLELMEAVFSGCSSTALWLTTDKLLTRAILAAAGIPLPRGGWLDPENPSILDQVPGPWIVKPSREEASVGISDASFCPTRGSAIAQANLLESQFIRQPIVVEEYLPGREFNVSLLADGQSVEVLSVAEIEFVDYPSEGPRILTYNAKWKLESRDFINTARRFPEESSDFPLLSEIKRLAKDTWHSCRLSGYARVDMRLDQEGRPHIIDVNGNPCLAADAGFMAAATRSGLSHTDVIARVLGDALARTGRLPERPGDIERKTIGRHFCNDHSFETTSICTVDDRSQIEDILQRTGFFNQGEIEMALELIDDGISKGSLSHYQFLLAREGRRTIGYACWGAIPGTAVSADLYWIVVDPRYQGRGIGKILLNATEDAIAMSGRSRVYVETSTRPQYEPTRRFYKTRGYKLEAELADFYAPTDGKAIYLKVLTS